MPGTTLIVTAALAMLAFSPGGDRDPSRGQAGTTAAPQQDGRGERARRVGSGRRPAPRRPARTSARPDAREAGTKPGQSVQPADVAARPEPMAATTVGATPIASEDGTSPLVYILPGIALSLVLAIGLGYAVRTSRARPALGSAPDHPVGSGIVIQRQLGHSNLGITSVYLQGIEAAKSSRLCRRRLAPKPEAPTTGRSAWPGRFS